ncbi:hypothetical protein BDW67DRAFT_60531 [Aspergillus spinulosporus]
MCPRSLLDLFDLYRRLLSVLSALMRAEAFPDINSQQSDNIKKKKRKKRKNKFKIHLAGSCQGSPLHLYLYQASRFVSDTYSVSLKDREAAHSRSTRYS